MTGRRAHHHRLATLFVVVCFAVNFASSSDFTSGVNVLKKLYEQCESWDDGLKCLKVQALKVVDRAMNSKSFGIITGINVIKSENSTARLLGAGSYRKLHLSDDKLERLENGQVNKMLVDAAQRFLESHRIEIDMPKLLEEGRGKKKNKYIGPMIAALMIKGGFMAVGMKFIAAMAGTALILGKMALLLSAILGLKKLVSSGGGETKTTFEIVKHPKHYAENTYSSSHYGAYDEAGGPYHRSLKEVDQDDLDMQDIPYRGQILRR